MFKNAKKYFERAIFFDNEYLPARQNLFVSELLLAESIEDRNIIIEKVKSSALAKNIKSDFLVIHEILKKAKIKKIEKIAKSGSLISKANLDKDIISESNLTDDEILEKVGIIKEVKALEHGFGFDTPRPKEKIVLKNANIQVFEISSSFVFKLGKNQYLVQSPKSSIPREILNENKSRFYEYKQNIYFSVE